jgi:hypothetical protein
LKASAEPDTMSRLAEPEVISNALEFLRARGCDCRRLCYVSSRREPARYGVQQTRRRARVRRRLQCEPEREGVVELACDGGG